MPKLYSEIDTSPVLDLTAQQARTLGRFRSGLESCRVADEFQWTCFAWSLDPQSRGRVYPGRDELVLRLHAAVTDLAEQGYRWPMIAEIVKAPPNVRKRCDGCWHVHIEEIASRLPSRDQREMIYKALRRVFSDVRLDDLTRSRDQAPWWKGRKKAKATGHPGYRRYAAKNVAEHDSDQPYATYRSSSVPGPELPGEHVTREILRVAREFSPVPTASGKHRSAQLEEKEVARLPGAPRPLFQQPTRRVRQNQSPVVVVKRTTAKRLRPKPDRRPFEDVLLRSAQQELRQVTKHDGTVVMREVSILTFECPDGEWVRWHSWNPLPVIGPDGVLYALEPGLRWNFEASIILRNRHTIRSLSRVSNPSTGKLRKISLLDQPEGTRLVYAEKYGISRSLLELPPIVIDRESYNWLIPEPNHRLTAIREPISRFHVGACDIRAPPRPGRGLAPFVHPHHTPHRPLGGWLRHAARVLREPHNWTHWRGSIVTGRKRPEKSP